MKFKRIISLILASALVLCACSKGGDKPSGETVVIDGDNSAVELSPAENNVPTATPTIAEPPNEKDIEYANWIQTVLLMAPHSEVDGLFVHMDPESLEYLAGIVGERIELTAQDTEQNLFYRYIAFTLGVSSFSELSEKIDSPRASGKIYFTLTYSFDDPRRRMVVEFDGTNTKVR